MHSRTPAVSSGHDDGDKVPLGRHMNVSSSTGKLASLASQNSGSGQTRPIHARERSLQRDDVFVPNPSSRPASIRSASSFNRPVNSHRFVQGHHTRRHSNYSNFSTVSETSLPWTTRDIGFNAISGVLNDPAKRPAASTKPSKSDIPPVPHASIPKIKSSDFDAYLAHITPVFERYQQNKLVDHDEPTTHSPYGALHNILDEESLPVHQRRSTRNPYSIPQIMSSESLSLDVDDVKSSSHELPMIENIPSIFFEPDFHLENPRTFDAVCEGADIIGNSGANASVSTSTILQEKLSYYLDTVEVHLLQEIENRSSSFFEALSNLQALHQQTMECVSQIHAIREKMKRIQETECKNGLQVIRLQIRQRNLEKLVQAIESVKEIRSAQPMIQILLGQGDYFAALDLIDETRRTLRRKTGAVDLEAVRSLANFSTQLAEMQKAVGIMMQHDFVSILLSDMMQRVEIMDAAAVKLRLVEASDRETTDQPTPWAPDLDKEQNLVDQLLPSTKGLLRTEMLGPTLQTYKEQLTVEMKGLMRKCYPSESKESPDASPNLQAKQLKSMAFNDYFEMLQGVFTTLVVAFERVATYHHLLVKVIEKGMVQQESDDESGDDLPLSFKKDLFEVLFAATDIINIRCSKLIGYRNDQNALLNPTDFYRLSRMIQRFIQACEMYCNRSCFGLRSTLLSQQKAFIDHFHMERIKQEAQLIENEQWVASEVPTDFQRIVDRICDGGISSFAASEESQTEERKSSEQPRSSKLLVVNGSSYFVVGCSLLILKMFEEYLRCILNLEGMATDIMQKLVEMLKLFNSRVCQVILGAGAMRSAGLKNISAKHLALASQSIGIMIQLVPSLKECVRRHMPVKHAVLLSEFDRIVNDYRDHQGEIHAKLVAIMNERFTVHIKAMQSIKWDEDNSTGKNANSYMETLVKETMTLHKVLSKYLPVQDLQSVMSRVFDSFTTQLVQEIEKLSIRTKLGKDRLITDVTYFTRRLTSLQNVDPPSNSVMEAVNKISLPATSPN
ncbi:Vps54-like protein-domain-containing protein [Radiomyces spectabilis]|uniref:Vps54-like protein-domain-containing protein n=1 Tax=Radiomyces spectabilis TaxID=64574 RepID=UPI002220033E|nr:Vps54-like protein-domain-containing protein [Radiomyces spectabilis]KAI8379270.1 Vps54-like protein-domain-containing protein [Radiomyces spectabilis]